MQSNQQKQYPDGSEIEYAKYLYLENLIPEPGKCSCRSNNFYIHVDNANKKIKLRNSSFRCQNIKCN